jgi:hypothetical protein
MRNLARNVMQDVGFRNTISGVCANPSHNTSRVAEKVAVQSGKGSAGKGELWGTVMGKKGVCML